MEEESEVERILSHKGKGKKLKYLMAWIDGDEMWETPHCLRNAPDVLWDYLRLHPLVLPPPWLSRVQPQTGDSVMDPREHKLLA